MNSKINVNLKPVGLVTIDVEPDNVWANTHSRSYENIKSLPKFHALCSEFGIRPTYLVSWSIANNADCAKILESLLHQGNCEIGIHPHLWETPPKITQDTSERAWVGPDYAESVLNDKIENLANLIGKRFGRPISHRAGRWGIDFRQVGILKSHGIEVDTSVIPGVDWSSTGILDHTLAPIDPYFVGSHGILDEGSEGLLEVPCTIKPGLKLFGLESNTYVGRIISRVGQGYQWLRASPNLSPEQMIHTSKWAIEQLTHLNLMSHSSEFMPGGSPYWKSLNDIERQFQMFRKLFTYWQASGVRPMTLAEFARDYKLRVEKGEND